MTVEILTIQEIKDTSQNARILNQVVTSTELMTPSLATDGESKSTLAGYDDLVKTRLEEQLVVYGGFVPTGSYQAETSPGVGGYSYVTNNLFDEGGLTYLVTSDFVSTTFSNDKTLNVFTIQQGLSTSTGTVKITSVFDADGFSRLQVGTSVDLISYHESANTGGGRGVGVIARHNGGAIISKTRTRPPIWGDDSEGAMTAWFADSGVDELCMMRTSSTVNIEDYGAKNGTDIQQVYEKAVSTNSVIYFNPAFTYDLNSLAVTPANTIVDFQDTQINVNSTNYGFVMGDNAGVLQYRIKLLNVNFIATNKTVNTIWSRANVKCEATGYIECPIFGGAEDATRTNVGLFVDGANVSSFGNRWSIQFNHTHECVRVGTSGTIHPTAQLFDDCYLLGDQSTDPTSIGYNFAGNGSVTQIGQGTVIRGGNVELVNTGFYIGANTGSITVIGTRMEINQTATSWKIDFANGCDPCSFTEIQGLGVDFVDVNSGVRNIASNTHTVSGLDFNDTRIGGYAGRHPATPLVGYGGANFSEYFDADSIIYRLQNSGSTGTGEITTQAGNGSAASGGGISLFGGSHATYAGEVHIAPAPSALFKVKQGLYGTDRMTVSSSDISPGADNTSSIGTAPKRPTQLYATTGTVNTSDEREKTEITTITETLKLIGKEIKEKIGMFQWLDSVEKKGDDGARWHFGVGAQTVKTIFEEYGLDGFKYGCLCYDEWPELPEKLGEITEMDDEGNKVSKTVVTQEYRAAGNRYGIRADQIQFLILASL